MLPSPGWVIGAPTGTPSVCAAAAAVNRSQGSTVGSATGSGADVVAATSDVAAVPDVPVPDTDGARVTSETAEGATLASPDEAFSLPAHPAETLMSSAVEQTRAT